MTATTPLQLQAHWKLSQIIKPSQKRLIKEPNFTYLGDTVIIWSIRKGLQNPKKPSLAEDILCKAAKHKMLQDNKHHTENILRNNCKQFQSVMEGLLSVIFSLWWWIQDLSFCRMTPDNVRFGHFCSCWLEDWGKISLLQMIHYLSATIQALSISYKVL
jgi:hypothetical protein